MTTRLHRWLPVAAVLLLMPASASAHPGHAIADHPLLQGVVHPLTGVDHLAAMLMVGLWGGMLAGRSRWAVPLAFVAAMVGGFGYAALGGSAGGMEFAIALSVLMLGGALLLRLRTPVVLACAACGAFGFAHGMAHGAEAPLAGSAAFAVGFVASTAALHGLGLFLAGRVPAAWLRVFGGAGAGLGLLMLAG